MNKRVALFDLNGTLLDDLLVIFEATCKIFDEHGVRRPSIREWFTRLENDYVSVYESFGIKTSRKELNRIFLDYYKSQMGKIKLSQNVKEALQGLKEKDVFLGIITTQLEELALPILERHGIAPYFEEVNYHIFDKLKTIKESMQKHGFRPENCFYIGDTPADIRHSRRAGVKAVAYIHGHIPIDLINNALPRFWIRDMKELPEIVLTPPL